MSQKCNPFGSSKQQIIISLRIGLIRYRIYDLLWGASLSDILFSFVVEKYIVCDACGLRFPSFESSSVLYISPTDTSSMQNLILQGLQQKLQKACSRCNNNTWHVKSSYILQPPNYLLLFVNRFRYINDNVTKDRCSIPMDTTVRLRPLKFSLRATIDHMDRLYIPVIILHLSIVEKRLYCNDHTITEFGIIDSKNSSTAYVILYELIDTWFLHSNRRVGVWSLPWRWHILSIPLTTGRRTGAKTCGLDDVFPPDDLCSRPEALCLYIYRHFLYEFCYRTYIYIQQECHSVLVKLHPATFYRTVFLGSAQFRVWIPLFVFFGLPIVSCSLMIIV